MNLGIAFLSVVFVCCLVAAVCWRKEDMFDHIRDVLEVKSQKEKSRNTSLDKWLRQAGLRISSEEWILINLAGFLTILAFSQIFGAHLVLGLCVGICGCGVINYSVGYRITYRYRQIDTEIEGVLLDMAASLWTNPSIKKALETAKAEAHGLIKNDLDRVLREIEHGVNSNEALQRWADRNSSETLKLCVRMVIICRLTGGKLAPVLERLAKITRERMAIEREIEAHAAQPKATAVAVFIVPLFFIVLAGLINPGYLGYLWSRSGLMFLIYSAASIGFGFFCLKQQVKSILGDS